MAKPNSLYDADVYLWTQQQAELLRRGRLGELDLPQLIEEVEDLGRNELHAVESHVETILQHLLKLAFSPADQPRRGWRVTLRTQRGRLRRRLTTSLRNQLLAGLDEIYRDARDAAAIELETDGVPSDRLPAPCPYPLDRRLDPVSLPTNAHGLRD